MDVKKFNEEVFFAVGRILKVGRGDIEFLKEKAQFNERKRIRLCTHKNVKDNLHEMFIVHKKDAYIRPHKHHNKIESFHIIEGLADIILFDENGNIIEVIQMSNYSSGRKFYYRISTPYYHTLLIRSDILVFHEVTNGPFNKSDTIFASWAPKESDPAAARKFMDGLRAARQKCRRTI